MSGLEKLIELGRHTIRIEMNTSMVPFSLRSEYFWEQIYNSLVSRHCVVTVFVQFLLLVLIARCMHPAAEVHIHLPKSSSVVLRNISNNLTPVENEILHYLHNSDGMTARMIHDVMSALFPELEREDVSNHLYTLLGKGQVVMTNSETAAPMWRAVER